MTSPISPKPGMNVRYVDAAGAIGNVTVAAAEGDAITIPGVDQPVPYDEARSSGSWHLSASMRARLPRKPRAEAAQEETIPQQAPEVTQAAAVTEPAAAATEPAKKKGKK